MLIKNILKIIFISFLLSSFLIFKNNAKQLQNNIKNINTSINSAKLIFAQKETQFSLEVHSRSELPDDKYIETAEVFLIESYLNQESPIVRVNYDKKFN